MTNKKELGQFFTPAIIADFMVNLGLTSHTESILDPAAGQGVFLESINNTSKQYSKTAFEIDPSIAEAFNARITDSDTKLLVENYLLYDLKEKFDFIICNPPYNKFHKLNNRKFLIEMFFRKYNIRLSGYSNCCVYFLIKSINELNKNGKCIYIIPYEFLNCGYGTVIKEYLLKLKILKSIYKFDSSIKLFSDAITTSCILELENSIHDEISFINIKNFDGTDTISKDNFSSVAIYKYNNLNPKSKWLNYFNNNIITAEYKNLIPLKSIAKVSRGIATGCNNYFMLNKKKIADFKLSQSVCLPCIAKSPDVKALIFDEREFNRLYENNKNVFIFNGKNAATENDRKYIELGLKNNVDKFFLTSHRTTWYSIENKEAAPIWISVFSRNKPKIIRNECNIRNLTAFHGLYLKDSFDKNDINILFCYLLTPVSHNILFLNKREYGGGLNKFEPNDLNNAFILNIKKLSNADKISVNKLYKQLTVNQDKTIDKLNEIFKKYIF